MNVLSIIESRTLKSPTSTLLLYVSPFSSVSVYFIYLNVLMLSTYIVIIIIFLWWIDSFIIIYNVLLCPLVTLKTCHHYYDLNFWLQRHAFLMPFLIMSWPKKSPDLHVCWSPEAEQCIWLVLSHNINTSILMDFLVLIKQFCQLLSFILFDFFFLTITIIPVHLLFF